MDVGKRADDRLVADEGPSMQNQQWPDGVFVSDSPLQEGKPSVDKKPDLCTNPTRDAPHEFLLDSVGTGSILAVGLV